MQRWSPSLRQLGKFPLKGSNVLKRPIDRGKSDVGNRIETFQTLHDNLTQGAGGEFVFLKMLDITLDAADEFFEVILRDWSLFEGFANPTLKFLSRIRLPTSITFYDGDIEDFHLFVRREPKAAFNAFPAAPDGEAF